MASGLRQQIRFCTAARNTRIAYATMGTGSPLVKTAHWLTHLEADLRSPIWQPWLQRLSHRRTLIRYDERGCGLSDRRVGAFSFDDWLHDLEAVVAAAGLERFGLLGMSQGGAVAIAYAARYPERVSHLVLCGAYARGHLRRSGTDSARTEARLLHQLIELGWGRSNPAFRQVFTSLFIPDGSAEDYRWFNELQRASASPETAARILATCDSIDVTELAAGLQVPTLVLHARGDARVPFEQGRKLAGLIPGARFVPLASNNHAILPAETAWRQLHEEVDAFLAEEHPRTEISGPRAAWESELTNRERDVLELVARGLNNGTIAQQLSLSEKTVRNYLTRLLAKLGADDRPRAIVLAREAGFGRHSTH